MRWKMSHRSGYELSLQAKSAGCPNRDCSGNLNRCLAMTARRFAMIAASILLILPPPVFAKNHDRDLRAIVTVIKASNEGRDFNLDNDAFRDELLRLFSFTRYDQLDKASVNLNRAERVTVGLTDNYEMVLTLQGIENKDTAIISAILRRGDNQYVNTVLSSKMPGVVFLGGPPMGSGALIIVLEIGF